MNATADTEAIVRMLPSGASGIELHNCGYQPRNPRHFFGPVVRDEYILQYATAGAGELNVRGKTHVLKAGDLFLLEPNTLLRYAANPADPYAYYWVGFGGSEAAELLAHAGFTADTPVLHLSDPQAEACMRAVFESGERTDGQSLMRALSEFYRLFSLLLPASTSKHSTANETVNRALAILHERYREELHIGKLCRELGIDRTYFSVLFRRATGSSPGEYLIRYRLSQACRLLESTLSVTEIAMACGFSDAANFSVRFKKLTGKTPRQYRNDLCADPAPLPFDKKNG